MGLYYYGLSKDEEEGFGHLFPPCSIWDKVSCSPLMLVQLNHFSCGGIAIAVCLAHRIADGRTLFSFLSYWASLSCNPGDEEKLVQLAPYFVHGLLPNSYDDDFVMTDDLPPEKNWITTEIVFYNSKIAELKAVNMRPLIDPPLPKTSVGNLIIPCHISASTMKEKELHSLVVQMRKEKKQITGIRSLVRKEVLPLFEKYARENYKKYAVSSMCNFPSYDKLNFGWGKPVNASLVDGPFVNIFEMMDTPDGDGIE
ncbi:hypothetical protein AgCh_024670 [Apium graveolens]